MLDPLGDDQLSQILEIDDKPPINHSEKGNCYW